MKGARILKNERWKKETKEERKMKEVVEVTRSKSTVNRTLLRQQLYRCAQPTNYPARKYYRLQGELCAFLVLTQLGKTRLEKNRRER